MNEVVKRKEEREEEFYYLGNKYDVVILNTVSKIEFVGSQVFVKNKTYLKNTISKSDKFNYFALLFMNITTCYIVAYFFVYILSSVRVGNICAELFVSCFLRKGNLKPLITAEAEPL